jgi:hypothetical protein
MPRLPAGLGTLAVRTMLFGTAKGVGHVSAILARLDSSSMPPRAIAGIDSSSVLVFQQIPAGRYELKLRRIGLVARTDTVVVRSRAADTVTIALRDFQEDYWNTYNCRPRRFRHPGETACLDDAEETGWAVARVRALADSATLRLFPMIPKFDSSEVALITDEAVCERAARAYSNPDDPPRRVIVVRMGQLFIVHDPHEPLRAGEWHLWRVFDRRWESIVNLAR